MPRPELHVVARMNTYTVKFRDGDPDVEIEAEYLTLGHTYVRFCRARSRSDGDCPDMPQQILGLVPHDQIMAVIMTKREPT